MKPGWVVRLSLVLAVPLLLAVYIVAIIHYAQADGLNSWQCSLAFIAPVAIALLVVLGTALFLCFPKIIGFVKSGCQIG